MGDGMGWDMRREGRDVYLPSLPRPLRPPRSPVAAPPSLPSRRVSVGPLPAAVSPCQRPPPPLPDTPPPRRPLLHSIPSVARAPRRARRAGRVPAGSPARVPSAKRGESAAFRNALRRLTMACPLPCADCAFRRRGARPGAARRDTKALLFKPLYNVDYARGLSDGGAQGTWRALHVCKLL